ncbi:hypothetical protein T459_01013 [Capsicum annuum]|uniref:Uncharacterized protein n=1 Tax=Capsicum annuum TaxID=4072 RepID=A0A2G3AFW0_CAPAN|nr:hypothetical protein T459_01013 [Capsicum annuum]
MSSSNEEDSLQLCMLNVTATAGFNPFGKNVLVPEEMILRGNPNLVVEGIKNMVIRQNCHHKEAGIDGFCLSLMAFVVGHHKCGKLPRMSSLRSWFLPKADGLRGRASQIGKLPRMSSHRSCILPKADELHGRASQMWISGSPSKRLKFKTEYMLDQDKSSIGDEENVNDITSNVHMYTDARDHGRGKSMLLPKEKRSWLLIVFIVLLVELEELSVIVFVMLHIELEELAVMVPSVLQFEIMKSVVMAFDMLQAELMEHLVIVPIVLWAELRKIDVLKALMMLDVLKALMMLDVLEALMVLDILEALMVLDVLEDELMKSIVIKVVLEAVL